MQGDLSDDAGDLGSECVSCTFVSSAASFWCCFLLNVLPMRVPTRHSGVDGAVWAGARDEAGLRPSPGDLSRSCLSPREALPGGLCHERWSTMLFAFLCDEPLAIFYPLKPHEPPGHEHD